MAGKQEGDASKAMIQFPMTKSGKRSTIEFGKYVWSAAAKAAGLSEALQKSLAKEKDFRHQYIRYIEAIYEKAGADAGTMYAVAEAGLAAFHDAEKGMQFEFNGKEESLAAAVARGQPGMRLEAIEVAGSAPTACRSYPVTFNQSEVVEGAALKERITKLVAYGWMEKTAGDAMQATLESIESGELVKAMRKYCFVAIGGTSEMGPVRALLETGATVLAIARGSAKKWSDLIEFAKTTPGSLLVPVLTEEGAAAVTSEGDLATQAGCDVLANAPELYRLLLSLEKKKTLVIGNYIYLDGELHVRATAAMDILVREVCGARPSTKLAYMCSHSTMYFIPQECAKERFDGYQSGKYSKWWMNMGGFGAGQKTAPGDGPVMYNGLNMTQGPNYALAKSLQNWRAMVMRRAGHCVSSPIAPVTSTSSIVSNPSFLYGIQGLCNFGPMIVPGSETTSKLLALILLHDVTDPRSVANPKTTLAHPLHLFMEEAVHGGQWRSPFDPAGSAYLYSAYILGRIYGQKTFAQILD